LSLWATSRYDLRLTDAEFYALTPRQFDALTKRRTREQESQEFMFAQLTAVVMNTGFRSTDKPSKTIDFMPSQWAKGTTPKTTTEMTEERRQAIADMFRMGLT
jgi:hypothetical protein